MQTPDLESSEVGLEILHVPCWFAQRTLSCWSGDHTLSSKTLKQFNEEALGENVEGPLAIFSHEKYYLLNVKTLLGKASESIITSFQVWAASE